MAKTLTSAERRFTLLSTVAAATTAVLGGGYFLAWLSGVMTYRGIHSTTIKCNSALCLLLLGVALLLVMRPPRLPLLWLARTLAAVAMVIGGLTLLEHLFGWDLGIDQLLTREAPGALGMIHPNRMGPPSTVSFLLGGAAIQFLGKSDERAWGTAQRLGVILCLLPLLSLLGYLYGGKGLVGAARITAIAWPTAAGLFCLAVGIVCAKPSTGFMSQIASPDPGGVTIRRLLPAAFLIPILFTWLRLEGEWRGLYERYFGTGIMVVAFVVIFSLLIYQTGSRVSRSSAELQRQRNLLSESEERLRLFVEHAPAALAMFDRQMRYLSASRRWLRDYHIEGCTVEGRCHYDVFPEIPDRWREIHNRALQGEVVTAEEDPFPRKDGSVQWLKWEVRPWNDAAGDIAGIMVFSEDISTRKQAEQELRVREAMLDAFFASSPGILNLFDEELRFLNSDLTTPTYFGLDRKGIIGKAMGELDPAVERSLLATREKVRERGSLMNVEFAMRLPGREHELDFRASYFWVPLPEGKKGLGLMAVEITDLKRAEQEVRRSEARLNTALDILGEGVIMATSGGNLFYWNHSAMFTHGFTSPGEAHRSAEELQGIFELWTPDGLHLLDIEEWPMSRIQRGETVQALELRLRRLGQGWERVVSYSGALLETSGGERLIYLTLHDLTDQRQAEERLRLEQSQLRKAEELLRKAKDELEIRVQERTHELERAYGRLQSETEERLAAIENLRKNEQLLLQQSRLAAMGEMLGNIAHQWRQPLNNLGLIIQDLLLSFDMGEMDREYLSQAIKKAMRLIQHMSHTIDDFRRFLQPETEKAIFNVNQAVATTLSLFEATLKAMEVALEVRESEQIFIEGHRNEFSQVIMNLITNARDAFKERAIHSPRLRIELFREGGRSVITFTDNAGGIPEEIIEKIFDPYFTTKGPDKGTGIGLFMSKNIIEKSMGGSLTVRNTGAGAEFRIEV